MRYMQNMRHQPLALLALTLVALTAVVATPKRAHAVDPFEVQVYEGDANLAGQVGLELHTNYVLSGPKTAVAPEVAAHRLLRTTLEPSLGVTSWWELGAYLQMATETAHSGAHWGGFKLRSKFVATPAITQKLGGVVVGLNIEVGRGAASFGGTDWDTEVRPIVAYAWKRLFFAVNPIVGWALTGERHAAPDFEPAGKVRFDTHAGFGVGLEYFAGLGLLSDVSPVKQQQHILYLAGDLVDGPIELNVGIGHGLTEQDRDWTVKTIVGHAF